MQPTQISLKKFNIELDPDPWDKDREVKRPAPLPVQLTSLSPYQDITTADERKLDEVKRASKAAVSSNLAKTFGLDFLRKESSTYLQSLDLEGYKRKFSFFFSASSH